MDKADRKIEISIESLDKLNAIVTRFENAVNQLNNQTITYPLECKGISIDVDKKLQREFEKLIK